MSKQSTLIYELKGLKMSYNDHVALNVGRLQFHRGTIYGIIGSIGSGKSTLLNVMAGLEKESEGSIMYDMKSFDRNWLGKVKPRAEIKLFNSTNKNNNKKVSSLLKEKIPNENLSTYFKNESLNLILEKSVSDLSLAESSYLNMILAINCDPRVLLIDDYAIHFDKSMEIDFRKKLLRMNKDLGTTILLSAPHDQLLKSIASVLIYLDNGHISKIRSNSSKSKMIKPKKDNETRIKSKKKYKNSYSKQRSDR